MNDWQDAEQRVEKAQELFSQHKWQEAVEELRAAIGLNPYNPAWSFNLGLTLDEMGRFEEAVSAYREALRIEPDDCEALYRIGLDQVRLGRSREAITTFNQIETINPAYEPAYCGRIVAYTDLGEHERAEEMFYLAREYKEECPNCFFSIAQSLAQRQLYDKALYCWQKTLDLDESHPQVHLHMARALWEKGDLEKARYHFQQEWRLSPHDIEALLDLGDLLLQLGRTDEAGEKLRRAIELAPSDPRGYLHWGRWLLACDRLDLASEALSRALQLDPMCPGPHLFLAQIALREGDRPQARRHIRAELHLRPPHLMMDLANLLIDTGHLWAATACLRRLIAQRPHDSAAWQNLAVAQFMRSHYDQGIGSCQQALAADPHQFGPMFNLALAYERMGDYDRSLAWLKRAAEITPSDPSLQHLEIRLRLLMGWAWLKRKLAPLAFWSA